MIRSGALCDGYETVRRTGRKSGIFLGDCVKLLTCFDVNRIGEKVEKESQKRFFFHISYTAFSQMTDNMESFRKG